MTQISQRFKMGYGQNLNKNSSFYINPSRSKNINTLNNVDMYKINQKRLLKIQLYQMYKNKMQNQMYMQMQNTNKTIPLEIKDVYEVAREIKPMNKIISPHFKDYDTEANNSDADLEIELTHKVLNEDLSDSDIDE
jgi:hypothetical protein